MAKNGQKLVFIMEPPPIQFGAVALVLGQIFIELSTLNGFVRLGTRAQMSIKEIIEVRFIRSLLAKKNSLRPGVSLYKKGANWLFSFFRLALRHDP